MIHILLLLRFWRKGGFVSIPMLLCVLVLVLSPLLITLLKDISERM